MCVRLDAQVFKKCVFAHKKGSKTHKRRQNSIPAPQQEYYLGSMHAFSKSLVYFTFFLLLSKKIDTIQSIIFMVNLLFMKNVICCCLVGFLGPFFPIFVLILLTSKHFSATIFYSSDNYSTHHLISSPPLPRPQQKNQPSWFYDMREIADFTSFDRTTAVFVNHAKMKFSEE